MSALNALVRSTVALVVNNSRGILVSTRTKAGVGEVCPGARSSLEQQSAMVLYLLGVKVLIPRVDVLDTYDCLIGG